MRLPISLSETEDDNEYCDKHSVYTSVELHTVCIHTSVKLKAAAKQRVSIRRCQSATFQRSARQHKTAGVTARQRTQGRCIARYVSAFVGANYIVGDRQLGARNARTGFFFTQRRAMANSAVELDRIATATMRYAAVHHHATPCVA